MDESFAQNFWLFGYGSLIWKPPPHFDKRVPGYITGYVRRFWQASEDHRGTPEAPGRVVTLIDHEHWQTLSSRDHHKSSTSSKVWGAAYHIPPEHVTEVQDYLDLREINGYSIQFAPFQPSPDRNIQQEYPKAIHCLVYIGLPDNPQFLGPQDPQALSVHILKSIGPSGENKEYLYMLGEALEELSMESGDEHIRDLVKRCKALEEAENATSSNSAETSVHNELSKVGSTDAQEETEK